LWREQNQQQKQKQKQQQAARNEGREKRKGSKARLIDGGIEETKNL
jgi:hypothetical protein